MEKCAFSKKIEKILQVGNSLKYGECNLEKIGQTENFQQNKYLEQKPLLIEISQISAHFQGFFTNFYAKIPIFSKVAKILKRAICAVKGKIFGTFFVLIFNQQERNTDCSRNARMNLIILKNFLGNCVKFYQKCTKH